MPEGVLILGRKEESEYAGGVKRHRLARDATSHRRSERRGGIADFAGGKPRIPAGRKRKIDNLLPNEEEGRQGACLLDASGERDENKVW